jgi:hypothetical protein
MVCKSRKVTPTAREVMSVIAEIKARWAKVTLGPWEVDDRYPENIYCDDPTGSIIATCPSRNVLRDPLNVSNNVWAISHAPTDIATLLRIAEAAEKVSCRFRFDEQGRWEIVCREGFSEDVQALAAALRGEGR